MVHYLLIKMKIFTIFRAYFVKPYERSNIRGISNGEHLRSNPAIPGTLLLFTITQVSYPQEESVNEAFVKNDFALYIQASRWMKHKHDITPDCQATAAINSKATVLTTFVNYTI